MCVLSYIIYIYIFSAANIITVYVDPILYVRVLPHSGTQHIVCMIGYGTGTLDIMHINGCELGASSFPPTHAQEGYLGSRGGIRLTSAYRRTKALLGLASFIMCWSLTKA